MQVGFFQANLQWEEPDANLAYFEEKIATIDVLPDFLVLPEMFNAGFSMNYSEPEGGKTFKWLQLMALRYKIFICGSFAIKTNLGKFNRFLCVGPEGIVATYDKKHLFARGGEDLSFTAGTKDIIFSLKGVKIKPQICFDLRFPENARFGPGHSYNMLVYVASWPETRIQHWDTLLQARAIENQAYTIGVNRIGSDGHNLNYSGHSVIYDFKGERMVYADENESYKSVSLDLNAQLDYRNSFNYLPE
jgi:omega-amidase